MTDDAPREAAGKDAGGAIPPAPAFTIRKVPPPTAAERQARRDAMDRAIRFGATPYRDAEGKARYVLFKEANNAPVEAWRRDPAAKRGFRKTQQARKAAGQLIWHPEDQIELAKRLGVIHYREGRSAEGAAERGLYDAIWRYEHVWDTFTTPRRIGPEIIDTGRVAAAAEEEARKLQAEDPKAKGGFFVRDRKNFGLIYVVANPDPDASLGQELVDGGGEDVTLGQAGVAASRPGAVPAVTRSRNVSPPATADDYFAILRKRLAPLEGGIADRPPNEDEGGKTNKGVSQILLDDLHKYKAKEYGSYPTDTGALTDDQIDTILRKEIFNPLHIWQIAEIRDLLVLVPELPAQLFDIGVLQGIGYAGQVLQETLDEVMGTDLRTKKAGKLEYDGVIGPATRKVIAQALATGKLQEVNNLIVDKRIVTLRGKRTVGSNPGWFPRAESFRITPSPSAGKPVRP